MVQIYKVCCQFWQCSLMIQLTGKMNNYTTHPIVWKIQATKTINYIFKYLWQDSESVSKFLLTQIFKSRNVFFFFKLDAVICRAIINTLEKNDVILGKYLPLHITLSFKCLMMPINRTQIISKHCTKNKVSH